MGMILITIFVVLTLLLLLLTFRHWLKRLVTYMRRYRIGRIAIFGLKVLPVVGFFVAYNYIAPYITPYELPQSQQPKRKVLSEGEYFMGIRSHFILPHDHSYGDLLIPKGSLIHRWGGRSSSGGESRPLRLSHLNSVRFPYPMEIAGVEAMAVRGGALELARDYWLRPLYDSKNNALFTEVQPEILCKKGEIAYFHRADFVNRTRRMMSHEFIRYENSTHYIPDTWLFVECRSEDRIDVPLPFRGKMGDVIEEEAL